MSEPQKPPSGGFKALRNLPPPSPEALAALAEGFPERLRAYEKKFAANSALETVSDRWMDRSYDL